MEEHWDKVDAFAWMIQLNLERNSDKTWAVLANGNVVKEMVSMQEVLYFLNELPPEDTGFTVQHWEGKRWVDVKMSDYTADIILAARERMAL